MSLYRDVVWMPAPAMGWPDIKATCNTMESAPQAWKSEMESKLLSFEKLLVNLQVSVLIHNSVRGLLSQYHHAKDARGF